MLRPSQPDLFEAEPVPVASASPDSAAKDSSDPIRLRVTVEFGECRIRLDWFVADPDSPVETMVIQPPQGTFGRGHLQWKTTAPPSKDSDRGGISDEKSSMERFLSQVQFRYPLQTDGLILEALPPPEAMDWPLDQRREIPRKEAQSGWELLAVLLRTLILEARKFNRLIRETGQDPHRLAALSLFCSHFLVESRVIRQRFFPGSQFALRFTQDFGQASTRFTWSVFPTDVVVAVAQVSVNERQLLSWRLFTGLKETTVETSVSSEAIAGMLDRWRDFFPVKDQDIDFGIIQRGPDGTRFEETVQMETNGGAKPWEAIHACLSAMAKAVSGFQGDTRLAFDSPEMRGAHVGRFLRKLQESERQAEEIQRRAALNARRIAAIEQARKRARELRRKLPIKTSAAPVPSSVPFERPPVAVKVELPRLEIQDVVLPLSNLDGWRLKERAALWWVSNQSDDLLCLPYCRLERLEYQIRSALRVLGPLRGRALLSDEVGLGKTIEAGLVLKELLTRGLVKRYLVLTLPSLVDQWEEELVSRFGLAPATTNQDIFRQDPAGFWRQHPGIVASLHTAKQTVHRHIAASVHWDMLIVDEAHHLRNRESQAWQAVNLLPRQYLLLLTATPVQNSLEELYNLVTLLQPGQLPSPREFRARFMDPKRPHQPRAPEELRRMLSQVMIRNTRANSGLQLPPRRAETVIFQPDPADREFLNTWEQEFRQALIRLPSAQASLWGRLALQAAGSSPFAWRSVLEKFPDSTLAATWREKAPLVASWKTKCSLLPSVTRFEGGAVIFTQFIETQMHLRDSLAEQGIAVEWINGSTPAADRERITDRFRAKGGALLLTRSGTEGRNLQFSSHLVNFDLPWNPMEIEQRIGRLHRLGQSRPVRIYNLVQAGTLQEHLLHILEEKLNLFELVVGETGLILGEQYTGEEFAEEILRRWREHSGQVAESFAGLGEELVAARETYNEIRRLDESLFAEDYESI